MDMVSLESIFWKLFSLLWITSFLKISNQVVKQKESFEVVTKLRVVCVCFFTMKASHVELGGMSCKKCLHVILLEEKVLYFRIILLSCCLFCVYHLVWEEILWWKYKSKSFHKLFYLQLVGIKLLTRTSETKAAKWWTTNKMTIANVYLEYMFVSSESSRECWDSYPIVFLQKQQRK